MRKLSITRKKSFVACLAKGKVYIEDAILGTVKICGVSCRKLGDLKNGETATFEIPNEQAKVFVIADMASKDYCNDMYQLPDGEEDIALTGKHFFNPANGNAFRFDNNDSVQARQNRVKGSNIGLIVLVIAIAVGVIVGFIWGFLA